MRLYHYTALLRLPAILREGITKGEVPISPHKVLNFPNLTSNPNPFAQAWSLGSATSKTRVRIAVNLDDNDPLLRSWARVSVDEKMERGWYRALNQVAGGQAKFWFIYWGVVPPTRFQEITVDGEPLKPGLIEEIERELVNITFRTDERGFTFVKAREGHRSWLLDGKQRAN